MGFLWFNKDKNIVEKDDGTRSETVKRVPIVQRLSIDGTNSTNYNMNVDGSGSAVRFFIRPPSGSQYYITRLIFLLEDAGTFDSGGWGNNGGTPLQNGIVIGFNIGGISKKLDFELKQHSDLAALAYDVNQVKWGSGNEFLMSRFTFSKLGTEMRLDGNKGDIFYADINDDLTYLKSQQIIAEGYVVQ